MLSSMGEYASVYWNQGLFKEAEELEVQIMEPRKKVLGPEHPDMLSSMVKLSTAYQERGRLKEAEELDVQVSYGRQQSLAKIGAWTSAPYRGVAAPYPFESAPRRRKPPDQLTPYRSIQGVNGRLDRRQRLGTSRRVSSFFH